MDQRPRQLALISLLLAGFAASVVAAEEESFFVAANDPPAGSEPELRNRLQTPPPAAPAPLRRRKPAKAVEATPEPAMDSRSTNSTAAPATAAPEAATVATPPAETSTEPAAAPEEALVRRRRQQGEAVATPAVAAPAAPRPMDPQVRPVRFAAADFRGDPVYSEPYSAEQQLAIYGGKRAVPTPRPLLELGYPLYSAGPLGATHDLLGSKNLLQPQFLVYGDFRSAYGNNDDSVHRSVLSNRLNLDLDLKLTGTERLHMLVRPLDQDGKFTRIDFDGPGVTGTDVEDELNAKPVTAFFEGDLGAIAQGFTGRYNGVDLPIAAGLVPLLFQNGVWLDDAFQGAAITLPARNSARLDISNFDITAFAGFDEVSTAALGTSGGKLAQHAGRIYGLASFVERRTYYYEFDYGYLDDRQKIGGFDHSYHNVSAAVTTRVRNLLSYSLRVIHNFGQERQPGFARTADGSVVLFESSFMTRKPYTLLPYLNLFYGEGRPQSLARDAGAGGLLKNTGINFETDNLTGFPKLEDNAANSHGGALGLQYLFNLDRQIVVELAGLDRHGDRSSLGSEYALGIRYQQPISQRWIFRTDGIVGDRSQGRDFSGARVELRCKF